MYREWILELIRCYILKDDGRFKEILDKLVKYEKANGNESEIYEIEQFIQETNKKSNNDSSYYKPSKGLIMRDNKSKKHLDSPKDKVSNSNLFEVIYPKDITNQSLIFNDKINNKIKEIVYEYNNKEQVIQLGLKVENKILLCGPPGCGKTSLAYELTKKLNIPLAYVKLDSLITSLMGQTSSNIRKIFESVKDESIVIFIDEFDAIAKKRADSNDLGELKRIVNSLLQIIDGIPDNVFFIAATNFEESLDSAIIRRFDSIINLERPNIDSLNKYIQTFLEDYKKFVLDIDINRISKFTLGMSFSEVNDLLSYSLKRQIVHKKEPSLSTDDIIESLVNKIFQFSEEYDQISRLAELNKKGISIRELSEITSIPKSTISDRIRKVKSNE